MSLYLSHRHWPSGGHLESLLQALDPRGDRSLNPKVFWLLSGLSKVMMATNSSLHEKASLSLSKSLHTSSPVSKFFRPPPSLFSTLRSVLCLGLFVWVLGSHCYGLEWNRQMIALEACSADEELSANFEFTNTSNKEVRILEVTTGCDCAQPDLDRRAYAPGEKGQLSIRFMIGSRSGVQTRNIIVQTNEAGKERQELMLKVTIEQLLSIKPRLVFWGLNTSSEAKRIRVTLSRPGASGALRLTTVSSDFTGSLKVIDESQGLYEVSLNPSSTARVAQAQFDLVYEYAGKMQKGSVFAAVR